MIRWGVLGAASIARRRVIPAIQKSSNGRVVAIASRDPQRARNLAMELDLARVHDDYSGLLNDPGVDAIYLPLPNHLHGAWTLAAVAAGKHVLCEKPLALTAGEAERMVAAARQADVLLAEAFAYRFHPRITRVIESAQEGALGDLRLIRFTFTFGPVAAGNYRHAPETGGGVLLDVGCYAVNLARLICGDEPQRVAALERLSSSGVDETFAGLLGFPSGVILTFDVSMAGQFSVSFEVVGSSGKLIAPLGIRPETDQPTELRITRGYNEEVLMIEGTDPYRLMVEDFADAILSGRPVRFDPEDAIANARVVDALRASARAQES